MTSVGLVGELAPQAGHLRLDRLALALEVRAALLEILLALDGIGPFLGLLGRTRRAGEDTLRTHVDVGQLDAPVGEEKLADLVGMGHTPRLEH